MTSVRRNSRTRKGFSAAIASRREPENNVQTWTDSHRFYRPNETARRVCLCPGLPQRRRRGRQRGTAFRIESTVNENPTDLNPAICEQILIVGLRKYVKGLKNLGVQPPAWGVASLTGTGGLYIRGNNWSVNEIDRGFLLIPEFEIANFDDDPGPLLKNTCDAIWNSAGFYESGTFNDSLQTAPAWVKE